MDLQRLAATNKINSNGVRPAEANENSAVSSPAFEWPKAASTAPSTRAPSPSAHAQATSRAIASTNLPDWIAAAGPTPNWNSLFDSSTTPPPNTVSSTQTIDTRLPDTTMDLAFKGGDLFDRRNDDDDEQCDRDAQRLQAGPSSQTLHAPIPAFASSYGHYQPVSGPYARFLTPSPGPSILENLDDLIGELRSSSRAASPRDAIHSQQQQQPPSQRSPKGEVVLPTIWDTLSSSSPSEGGASTAAPSNSLTIGIHGRTFDNGGRPSFEIDLGSREQTGGHAPSLFQPSQQLHPAGQRGELSNAVSSTESSPYESIGSVASTSSHAVNLSANAKGKRRESAGESSADAGEDAPKKRRRSGPGRGPTKLIASHGGGGRKGRNPHATQLPGDGARKQAQIEADDNHSGPVCSHCSSIVTPLWRRGPSDELLCNACGLYLKLHSKPRPIEFAKERSNKTGRTNLGVAAQAAAEGVAPSCHNCGATSTPMWRKDGEGHLCCNACSLYYKLHNTQRPAKLLYRKKRRSAATIKAEAEAAAAAAKSGASTTNAESSQMAKADSTSPDSSGLSSAKPSPPELAEATQQQRQPSLQGVPQQQQVPQQHLPPSFPPFWRPVSPRPRPEDLERLLKRPRIDESWERSTSPSNANATTAANMAAAAADQLTMLRSAMPQPAPAPLDAPPHFAANYHMHQLQQQHQHHLGMPPPAPPPSTATSPSGAFANPALHPPPIPHPQHQLHHLAGQQQQQHHQAAPPTAVPMPQQYAGLPVSAVGQVGYWGAYPVNMFNPPFPGARG